MFVFVFWGATHIPHYIAAAKTSCLPGRELSVLVLVAGRVVGRGRFAHCVEDLLLLQPCKGGTVSAVAIVVEMIVVCVALWLTIMT